MTGEFWAMPKEIMDNKELSPQAMLLFGILWTRKNQEDLTWPKTKYLADILHVTERSIYAYLRELEREKYITKQKIGKENIYSINS